MHPIANFILNPVKVAVGVILIVLFGAISAFRMPMQLAPDVTRPVVTVRTSWPGVSPQEVEKEIVNEQEEQLKSIAGLTRMTSDSSESRGSITLEFQVGTNMDEAVLKVNSQLQQVREYPLDADKPVIETSSNTDRSIAWFILSVRPPTLEQLQEFAGDHPQHAEAIGRIQAAFETNVGLAVYRIRELAENFPEAQSLVPPDIDVTRVRKFAEDVIEAAFERVPGVSTADVRGGEELELQVIIDPNRLAARGLTIADVTRVLRQANQDISAGDFWEGKRRYTVRTLGQFRSVEDVANQVVRTTDSTSVYIKDVATVQLGFKKPDGFVRRFGVSNIAISVNRESGANVMDIMRGLQQENDRLNESVLQRRNLILTQVYDETLYINSALNLVNQNIVLGGALTVIVLMLFLHVGSRTFVFIPLLAFSAVAALVISPWFFLLTLALIVAAGFWFARGTLVVAVAIPISIIGTFMILQYMGRTLNVISLAGLAFAVGMLVDNAVVVLENIFRYYQRGLSPLDAAQKGVSEVWGAVLASTLTTLFVFLPIVFLEGEAGQLFADIALAISAAVGLSLLISVIAIPTMAARILDPTHPTTSESRAKAAVRGFGHRFTNAVVALNDWIQKGWTRRVAVAVTLIVAAVGIAYALMPEIEYLPSGNRNLVICRVMPPPGYNVQQLAAMGEAVEQELKPYWNIDDATLQEQPLDYPAIDDFFYVARGTMIFMGLRAREPLKARKLIGLFQERLADKFPGSIVVASQTSIFGRGLSGGRTIEVEVVGPELPHLVSVGGQIMGMVKREFPPNTQARPVPSLDLSSPELHVKARPEQADLLGMNTAEIGLAVNALIDGAYVGDYFRGGEKIDLMVLGSDRYEAKTQDLATKYIATPNEPTPVRLDSIAQVSLGAGPEQISHSERQRAITIEITPPDEISLEKAINIIQTRMVDELEKSGRLEGGYQIVLRGTADKLAQTWGALKWNFLLAILITYLLMAALFESFAYPLVIILSVPMGAVGGLLGLKLLGVYLFLQDEPPQALDVLTMLGFVILVGTVVNNAILIVHQALIQIRQHAQTPHEAVLQSVRTRIRPIFMTTATTVFGLSPLVFFPGAGSELYRGLGSVVLGGLVVSTIFTLVLIPTLFTLMLDLKRSIAGWIRPLVVASAPATADAAPNATGSNDFGDLPEDSTADQSHNGDPRHPQPKEAV